MKRLLAIGFVILTTNLMAQPLATTPFELYGDHIIVQLSVDGSDPLDFIFDTGSGLTVIDLDVARELKLELHGKEAIAGAQGYIQGAKIKHNRIDLGKTKLESNLTLEAFDLSHLSISIGREVQGIIGYDLLHHHAVRLNYDDMAFEVYDFDKVPKEGEKVPFKLHNSIPVLEGKVSLLNGEQKEASFYMNTGAGTSLDFNTPFAKENDLLSKTGEHYSYLVKGVESKETKHYEGRVQSLNLDFYEFSNMPVGISQVKKGLQGDSKVSGILGNKVLSRFNIVFDYKSHKLYFEPNGNIEKPFTVNCSGLDVQMNKEMDKVLIHQIQDKGPAMNAGIDVNDELLSINGKPTSELTLIEIEDMLKTPGESVSLEIKSGEEVKTVTLELEELL